MGAIIAGAVIAAGGAVYAANQSSKASKAASAAMGNAAQPFKPKTLGAPSLVDWQNAGAKATGANWRNIVGDEKLGSEVNRFNRTQAMKGYEFFQPYFKQNQELIGRNAASFARGELPSDVVGNIGRAAAQRGIEGGFGMSQGAGGGGTALGGLNLRNLGLTSLDLSKWGTQFAESANKSAVGMTPGLFDLSSQFINPSLAMGGMQFNANAQNQVDQLNAGYQNAAGLQNTYLANSVAQSQGLMAYQGGLGQGQAIQGASNTVAGLLGQYAQMQQAQKMQNAYAQNTSNIPNAGNVSGYTYGANGYAQNTSNIPNAGNVSGYTYGANGYSPITS